MSKPTPARPRTTGSSRHSPSLRKRESAVCYATVLIRPKAATPKFVENQTRSAEEWHEARRVRPLDSIAQKIWLR